MYWVSKFVFFGIYIIFVEKKFNFRVVSGYKFDLFGTLKRSKAKFLVILKINSIYQKI